MDSVRSELWDSNPMTKAIHLTHFFPLFAGYGYKNLVVNNPLLGGCFFCYAKGKLLS
jgi:lysozyme family protein